MARTRNVIENVRVNNAFTCLNGAHFEGDKSSVRGSYVKQNPIFVVISYEIYKTRRRLVS